MTPGKKRKYFLVPVTILLLLFSYDIYSLNNLIPLVQKKLTTWTTKEGLPSNSITDILQDRKGYIWIATFNGLVRFDGINMDIFTKDKETGFSGNLNTVLLETKDGSLWIGTNGDGLARYKGRKFLLLKKSNGLSGNNIKSLFEDSSSNIWVGTKSGLSVIDNNGKILKIDLKNLSSEPIEQIYENSKNEMWITLSRGGVYKIKNSKISFEKKFDKLKKIVVLSIIESQKGEVWVGTRENGIYIYRKGKLQHKDYEFAVSTVNEIREGGAGCIWISTDSGLIRSFKGNIERFTDSEGLSDNLVMNTITDKEGNVWIATIRGGLSKLSDNKFTTLESSSGLVYDRVNAVFEDSRGIIWIGTDKGLSIFKNREFIKNSLTKKLKGIRIRHIMEDSRGNIWIATYSDLGVVKYSNGNIKNYSKSDGLTNNRCRVIMEDSPGNIWVGTGNGICLIKNGKIKQLTKEIFGIADNYILSLFEDSKKRIWITTNGGGISAISDGKVKNYSVSDGLSSNVVFRGYEDSDGIIWFTTGYGISRFDGNNFVNFKEEQGIPARALFQIVEDKTGKFWINSNPGIITVSKESLNKYAKGLIKKVEVTLYNNLDGLPDLPTPLGWVFIDKKENIWFPTLKGIAIINSLKIPMNSNPPPIFIENIFIDGKSYPFEKIRSLNPDYKRITFKYTALSYVIPHKVQYRYKLKGFDVDWNNLTTKREISYTRLPKGEYTFSVKAVNNDGVWSKKEAEFHFKQNPFFYQTIWFSLLILFSIAGIVALILGLRIRALRIRERELEKVVKERTSELETIDRIVKNVNKEIEFEKLLNVLLKQTLKLFPQTDKGIIFTLNHENSLYEPLIDIGYEEGILKGISLTAEEAYGRYIKSSEEMEEGVYILKNFQGIPAASKFEMFEKPRSLIAMTLIWGSNIEGYFILENSMNKEAFTLSDAKKMKRIREHAISAFFKARTHQILEEAAITDPLTKLNNRRKILNALNSEILRFERTRKTFAVAMCDIDHFKLFNDKHGHDCGDYVLKEVANLIRSSIRKQDDVGRWGGEEFLLVFTDTDKRGAGVISEKIREAINKRVFNYNGVELRITMTFGVSEFRSDKSVDSCIKDADDALYLGKQKGRNIVVIDEN